MITNFFRVIKRWVAWANFGSDNDPLGIKTDGVFAFVFVCVFVCLSRCFLDDFTIKDWYHTDNILQEYRRRCLVVQVMCCTLSTSLMTSTGHKVGQILKLPEPGRFLSYNGETDCHNLLCPIGHVYNALTFPFRCEDRQRSNSKPLSKIFNIDNATLLLWKFSDFISRQTVGIAGDIHVSCSHLVLTLITYAYSHSNIQHRQ